MPNTLKFLPVIAVGGILAAMFYLAPEASGDKGVKLNGAKFGFQHKAKPRSYISADLFLQSVGDLPGSFTLQGEIVSNFQMSDLKYKWILPPGVVMSGGSVEGDIGALNEGETRNLSQMFSIVAPSSGPRSVQLNVYQIIDGEAHGQIATFILEEQRMPGSENLKSQEELDKAAASVVQ